MRAIREACGIVLREAGPEALTTQRIADVAGVNIASLYQYFPNKDAVIADFLDHEAMGVARRTAELFNVVDRLSKQSLEHTLAAIVELELDQRRALVRLNPAFFARYPESVDVHAKVNALTQSRQNPEWGDWLPGFLLQHHERLASDDVNLLASICHGALMGVLVRCADLPDEDDAFAKAKVELLVLLLAYLLPTSPDRDHCEGLLRNLGDMLAELKD